MLIVTLVWSLRMGILSILGLPRAIPSIERVIATEKHVPAAVQISALTIPDNTFVGVLEREEDLLSAFERSTSMVHSSIESIRAKHDWLDPGYL